MTILREYKAGKVIVLLFSLLATAMPSIHLKGMRIGEIARAEGGLLYLVVMFTLAVATAYASVLSARELRR